MKNKQKEWHPATKPLTFKSRLAVLQTQIRIKRHSLGSSSVYELPDICYVH
jgi:hypothetical protein